jgi:hypothetical protein
MGVNGGFSRTELFARSAKGGAALMIAGSVAGTFARRAAADPISDSDLAYARLLVAAELLAADFYALVIAAKLFEGPALKSLKRALFNEHEHYDSVATILNDAGQPPAVAADIDFSYPKGAFASKASDPVSRCLSRRRRRAPVVCARATVCADRRQRGPTPERLHRAHRPRPGRHLVPGAVVDRRGVGCLGRVHQLARGEDSATRVLQRR